MARQSLSVNEVCSSKSVMRVSTGLIRVLHVVALYVFGFSETNFTATQALGQSQRNVMTMLSALMRCDVRKWNLALTFWEACDYGGTRFVVREPRHKLYRNASNW